MGSPLSPLERAVAVLRAEESPPPGTRERLRDRLAFSGSSVAAAPGIASGVAPGSAPWISRRSVTLAFATFVAGVILGAAVHALLVSRTGAPLASTAPEVHVESVPAIVTVFPPVPSSTASPPMASPPPITAPSRASSSASSESQLTAERRLLDRARADIVTGDADHALEQLRKHQRTFPNGILADERDALRVEALVKAGQYAEAQKLAREFTARAPDSLFSRTVRSAIDSIPVTDGRGDANPH